MRLHTGGLHAGRGGCGRTIGGTRTPPALGRHLRRRQLPGLLHILCDDADMEERYHAEYMEAGILCKIIVGDPSLVLSWTAEGLGNI